MTGPKFVLLCFLLVCYRRFPAIRGLLEQRDRRGEQGGDPHLRRGESIQLQGTCGYGDPPSKKNGWSNRCRIEIFSTKIMMASLRRMSDGDSSFTISHHIHSREHSI